MCRSLRRPRWNCERAALFHRCGSGHYPLRPVLRGSGRERGGGGQPGDLRRSRSSPRRAVSRSGHCCRPFSTCPPGRAGTGRPGSALGRGAGLGGRRTGPQQRGADARFAWSPAPRAGSVIAGVDRRAAILPAEAPEEIEQISPFTASIRYLEHLRKAWNHRYPEAPLGEQELTITIPASFDPAARELTAEAAQAAGFPARDPAGGAPVGPL